MVELAYADVCAGLLRHVIACAVQFRTTEDIPSVPYHFPRWGLYNCANVFKQRNKSFVPWDLRSRVKTSDMLCAVMTSVMNWYMFFYASCLRFLKTHG